MLINNGFAAHKSLELLKFCFDNNIILYRLPSHTSPKLRPCDVGDFEPPETAYREQVEQLDRGGANTVGKQHFKHCSTAGLVTSLSRSLDIKSGWSKTGLYPLNPDVVLRDI